MTPAFLHRTALFALGAAIVWGGGDFAGGMAVKRAGGTLQPALRVVLLSHFTSFILLALIALSRGDALPHGASVLWALGAGLAGGSSVLAFYIALADGEISSAAAISGLLAAAIPAVADAFLEGSPGLTAALGFVLAAGAIWLIASGGRIAARSSRRITLLAIASGAGFGVYFVALRMASRAGLFWPMSGSRLGSMSVCVVLLLATYRRASLTDARQSTALLDQPAIRWALATAVLDTGGNLLYMAATRAGRLDVAAVLASLYPASTILLATWLLHERPTRQQGIGMLIAAAAIVLITL